MIAALAVGACGDERRQRGQANDSTVDADKLEQEIEQNLSSKTVRSEVCDLSRRREERDRGQVHL